jgi:hypothetical protein
MPVAFLTLAITWTDIKTERFYRERPILHAMRQAYGGDSLKSDLARDILLTRFPIGSDATAAVAAVSREGFNCQKLAPHSIQPNSSEAALQRRAEEIRNQLRLQKEPEPKITRMDCQLLAPAQIGDTRWIVDLQVQETDRLDRIAVAIGGISF